VPDLKNKKSSGSSSQSSFGSGAYSRNLKVGSELQTVYETLEDYDDVSLGSVTGSLPVASDISCNCLDRRCRKQNEKSQRGGAEAVPSSIYDSPTSPSPLGAEGGYDEDEAADGEAESREPATLVIESSGVVIS